MLSSLYPTKIARKVKLSPQTGMTVNPRVPSSSGDNMVPPPNEEEKPQTSEIPKEPEEEMTPANSQIPSAEQSIEEVEKILHDLQLENEDNCEVTDADFDENGDPVFPHDLLAKLDEMVNKPKWIIPVLPKAELELLMDVTIKLAKKGKFLFWLLSD